MQARWSFPEAKGQGAPVDDSPSGVESLLLLAREEKLPADADEGLAQLLAELWKPERLKDVRLAAWFENGELVTTERDRGPVRFDQRREVGEIVARTQRHLHDRLREQFPYVRAVCYGFQEK
jgi:hypothetical protein